MNNGVYGGQGPLLVGLVWAESLVAFLLVAARIYTATQVVQDFGFDSLLAVATVVRSTPRTWTKSTSNAVYAHSIFLFHSS